MSRDPLLDPLYPPEPDPFAPVGPMQPLDPMDPAIQPISADPMMPQTPEESFMAGAEGAYGAEPNLLDEEIALQNAENEPEPNFPMAPQLKVSDKEKERLWKLIEENYIGAQIDHRARQEKFARNYEAMRRRVGQPGSKSNFSVPLIKWQVLALLAKVVDGLFGDDAEISSMAVEPNDLENAEAVGNYLTWLLFNAMDSKEPLTVGALRAILNGRSHFFVPYVRQEYDTPDSIECDYEGPKLCSLNPDDLVVPGEDAHCVDDFTWVLRKYWTTPDEIVALAGKIYFDEWAKPEKFRKLYEIAQDKTRREIWAYGGDETKTEQDRAESVERNWNHSAGEGILVWEWYGKYRLPKRTRAGNFRDGGDLDDFTNREIRTTDIVVRCFPQLDKHGIAGIQSLVEMYPKMRKRRPFGEITLNRDGSYWPPSLPEQLEDIEAELSVSENLLIDGGEIATHPLIFARPSMLATMQAIRYEPGMVIPSDQPSDVNVVNVNPNMTYALAHQQNLIGFAERVTGINDMNSGRQSDRPNAPRTARQTIAYLDQGNTRLNLSMTNIRDGLRKLIKYIWELDCQYAPPTKFFRITGKSGAGVLDRQQFGKMTPKERAGRYDFDIKFATSSHSKEAKKAALTEFAGIALATPLMQQNLEGQWHLLNEYSNIFNFFDFGRMVPRPPALPQPMHPDDEWQKMIQGEEVEVHPNDDHKLHINVHIKHVAQEMEADPSDKNLDAIRQMYHHIAAHEQGAIQQAQQEAQMQALQQVGQLIGGVAAGAQAIQGQAKGGSSIFGGGGESGGQPGMAGLMGAGQGQPGSLSLPGEESLDAGMA